MPRCQFACREQGPFQLRRRAALRRPVELRHAREIGGFDLEHRWLGWMAVGEPESPSAACPGVP